MFAEFINLHTSAHQVSLGTIDWFCGGTDAEANSDDVPKRALVSEPQRLEFLMCLFVDADHSRTRLLSLTKQLQQCGATGVSVSVGLTPLEQALAQQERVDRFDSLLGLAFMVCECVSVASMLAVIDFLRGHEGWTVVRVQNALLPPSWDGMSRGCAYPDLTLHARDEASGHIVKITLDLVPLLQIHRCDGGKESASAGALLGLDSAVLRVHGRMDSGAVDRIRSGVVRSLELHELEGLKAGEVPWERFGVLSPSSALTSLVVARATSFHGLSISTVCPAQMLRHLPLSVLALAACGLVGDVPNLIVDNCPALEELSLELNPGLKGPLPDSFGRLRGLRVLRLFGCSLGGVIPKTLCQLTRLTGLYLQVSEVSQSRAEICLYVVLPIKISA